MLALSLLIILVVILGFFLYFILTDYQPETKEIVLIPEQPDTISVGKPLHIVTWNIGYAGLNKDMDFFYEGGTKVRPAKTQVDKNMEGIGNYLFENDRETDFFLFQEIDENAKRSYYINQITCFGNVLRQFQPFYAMNYNVQFVPQPFMDPMGKVKSGLATYSRYSPISAERYALPFNFNLPLRVFMHDRCFFSLRFHTSNAKELVLVNVHNSGLDDGELRKAELAYFSKFLIEEYEKGNYVIAGGDFNQCPPTIQTEFAGQLFDMVDFHVIADTLFPAGWKFAFDNSAPSNRRTNVPYKKGETKVTLIDFFILSPNVSVESVKCDELEFEFSDHNPVKAVFRLME